MSTIEIERKIVATKIWFVRPGRERMEETHLLPERPTIEDLEPIVRPALAFAHAERLPVLIEGNLCDAFVNRDVYAAWRHSNPTTELGVFLNRARAVIFERRVWFDT